MEQRTLVLIKPDAMSRGLAGNVISDLNRLRLKIIGIKIVNVGKELAEQHYFEHKDKPFFNELIKHITGELHNNENVIAIVYKGENAIKKVKELAGETHPEQACPFSIRGKYGRICAGTWENIVHASDSQKSAKREIELWFNEDELVE